MLKKWLREPLLHFLLLGAALFLLYGLQNDQSVDDANRIVISEANIDRLLYLWGKRWQRPPTRSELDGIIAAQVREEVLYREALAMGLDQDDSIIRRRMAQKMEFIFSDLASKAEPTEEELSAYLKTHPDQFEVPERISFVQVYLNVNERGEQLDKNAALLLEELRVPGSAIDFTTVGDAFMFGQQHQSLSRHQVTRLFGKQFAEQIFDLPIGSWQEPITSGYGLHLVIINEKTAASAPTLDEVRGYVLNEWQTQQRKIVDEQFYQSLRTRYEVVIENGETQVSTDTINDLDNAQ